MAGWIEPLFLELFENRGGVDKCEFCGVILSVMKNEVVLSDGHYRIKGDISKTMLSESSLDRFAQTKTILSDFSLQCRVDGERLSVGMAIEKMIRVPGSIVELSAFSNLPFLEPDPALLDKLTPGELARSCISVKDRIIVKKNDFQRYSFGARSAALLAEGFHPPPSQPAQPPSSYDLTPSSATSSGRICSSSQPSQIDQDFDALFGEEEKEIVRETPAAVKMETQEEFYSCRGEETQPAEPVLQSQQQKPKEPETITLPASVQGIAGKPFLRWIECPADEAVVQALNPISFSRRAALEELLKFCGMDPL